jgi:dipeptidyl aminopeptidase/acylaminoacyl peptidase
MNGCGSRAPIARRTPWALVPALLLAVASCSSGSDDGSAATTAVGPRPTLAAGHCGDDQAGRYSQPTFTSHTAETVTFAEGLDADVYAPSDDPATCRAAIVWVHGGGFTGGTRNGPAEQAWGESLAGLGYAVMFIDYHVGSGEQFGLDQADDPVRGAVIRGAIDDVHTAVRWFRESAANFAVDPDRIALAGTSAGAMAVLGAGLTAAGTEQVCTMVSVSGALLSEWVGGESPSALLVHGGADEVVPFESSVAAQTAISTTGAVAELVPIEGVGHEITGVPPDQVVAAVSDWLFEHLAATCG